MNFQKIVKDTEPDMPISIPISSFSIKNKGSVVKISAFYLDFYNDLIEKWGFKCTETKFIQNDLSPDAKAMVWKWIAYRNIDTFARIKFELGVNAFRISGENIMGIFSIAYNLELDYKLNWRKNSWIKMYLPIYLRTQYQSKLFSFAGMYAEELNGIKEKLMERLNMSVYD